MQYYKGLDSVFLVSSPAPLGRILNYIKRIKLKQYSGSERGIRGKENLDNWTVNFMVDLGFVEVPKEKGKYTLTYSGEEVYELIKSEPEFIDNAKRGKTDMREIKSYLTKDKPEIYMKLREIFLRTAPLKNLAIFFHNNQIKSIGKHEFYEKYGKLFGFKIAGFNRITGAIQLAEFCDVLLENGGIKVYDPYYIDVVNYEEKQIIEKEVKEQLKTDEIDRGFFEDITPNLTPKKRQIVTNAIIRNFPLANKLKKIYNSKCQICGFTFKKKNGENYSEVHHIIPLGESGSDSINNMIVICSNCHSEVTYANVKLGRLLENKKEIFINGERRLISYNPHHFKATTRLNL